MPLKYPLAHEFVIVIADLYLPEESAVAADGVTGLARMARFGDRAPLKDGWRAWLARDLGHAQLAAEPAACVAARCADEATAGFLWLATPVHLVTGLTSLHLEQRGLLRLPLTTLRRLAEDFHIVFHGSGFKLTPLASGGFLLVGPAVSCADALEPARCIGVDMRTALPRAAELRRLGAEIELWLHEHPVNLTRIERGELPISTLWLWGGGRCTRAPNAPLAQSATAPLRAYGGDPYVDGLACAGGARAQALPERMDDLLHAPARCIVLVVELAACLEAERGFAVGAALALLDARWILPATGLVARGAVGTLRVLANDRCLSLTRRDRLRLWRAARPGLQGIK